MHRTETKKRALISASVAVAAIVFAIDLVLPLGVAGGVPHVAAVLLAVWAGDRRYTLAVAGLATVLTILAYFLSSDIGALPLQVLLNRMLAVFAIWVTAVLGQALSRSDDATREREQRLRAVLNAAVDGIITIDRQGKIVGVNSSTLRMFGYTEDELMGQNVGILMPSPYREEHDSYVARYQKTGESRIIGIGREAVGRRKDGSTFPADIAVSEVENLGLFTGIIRDITDRKQAEERALQAERLAAIGQVVASMAHESRNFLQRICNAVEFLEEMDKDNPEALKEISRIQAAEKNLERLLEELRQFAAPIKLDKSEVSLRSVWRQAWSNVTETRDSNNVRFDEPREQADHKVHIDAFRFGQVFRNLFENSLAACNDNPAVMVNCENEEGCLTITIRDNGPGLSTEQREHVFEPFFTTKPKGTGLGMAIVKRIIEAHGGDIRVGRSTDGAEFLINFPPGSV